VIVDLKPCPTMKDSGVPWLGQVPEHWGVRRGKNIFRCIDVRSETGEEELLTVSSERGVVPRRSANVTMFKAESYIGYKLCWPGDLVINSLWAWARGLGVSTYHGIVSSAYGVYRPTQNVNARFIHCLVRSTPFHWELRVRSKGVWTSRLQLTDDSFLAAPFPLPPLEEQTAIVRYLGYVDRRLRRYINAKQKLMGLLEEQKQAIIHRAVTRGLDPDAPVKPSGVEWLGDVPEHWEVKKLKYTVAFSGGGTPSKATDSFWSGHIPWISPKDMRSARITDSEDHVTEEAIVHSATSMVASGAVLLVVRSGILRRKIPVAINDVPVALNQDLKALRPKPELRSEYLLAVVQGNQTAFLNEWTKQGATVESIEYEFMANSPIPVPPLREQSAIIQYLAKATANIDSAAEGVRRQIELVREYRTRLMADVVTGKLDVREAAGNLPDGPDEPEPLDDVEELKDESDALSDELERMPEEAEA
jgi:type I restriction enzyme S subunit